MQNKYLLTTLLAGLLTLPSAWAAEPDHSHWDNLLQANIVSNDGGRSTAVNYQGMADQKKTLDQYLNGLSSVTQAEFDGWSKDDQLAFLLNAYNAWTVALILTEWPDLKSIKDLGSWVSSPWSKAFIPLLGETRTLDDIEHGLIRESGLYNNPLIHFAANCASVGCPPLRSEAYVGEHLDAQLEEQTRRFLSNTEQNRLEGDTLNVSSIFKWYRGDFEKDWLGYNRLEDFLYHYADALALPDRAAQRLKAGKLDIEFLDYDWRLNKTR